MNKFIKTFSVFLLGAMLSLFHIAKLDAIVAPKQSPGYTADNVHLLASVLIHEIGGSSQKFEYVQVLNVIMNRYYGYGGKKSIGDVLTARYQFSGANDDSQCAKNPAYCRYIQSGMTNAQYDARDGKKWGSGKWEMCKELARQALAGELADLTGGAVAYNVCRNAKGGWGRSSDSSLAINNHHQSGGGTRSQVSQQGSHCFYKNYKLDSRFDERLIASANQGTLVLSGAIASGDGASAYASAWDNGGFSGLYKEDEEQKYISLCTNESLTELSGSPVSKKYNSITHSLDRLPEVLVKIYNSISKISIIGSAVRCYATHIDPICVGGEALCLARFANLTYWIPGWFFSIAAFFMSLAVAMYFLDIGLKIAFAILMLPISFALWPFRPTQSKIQQNFSVIIHNSMLSAFLCIGIAYAIVLIEASANVVIDDSYFAEAINTSNSEFMAGYFSIVSKNIILIFFALIFGFKIIASSVNDYLNKIFDDAVFGGSSPMHTMGTQMIGTLNEHTVKPMAKLGKDIAFATTGRALAASGRSINRMANGDFSDIKNAVASTKKFAGKVGGYAASRIKNPAALFTDAGSLINKSVQTINKADAWVAKQENDLKNIFGKRSFYAGEYEDSKAAFGAAMDAKLQSRNQAVEKNVMGTAQALRSGTEAVGKAVADKAMEIPGASTVVKNAETVIQGAKSLGNASAEIAQQGAQMVKSGAEYLNNQANQSAFSFSPGNVGELFDSKTYKTIARLAGEAGKDLKTEGGSKIILKKGAQGAARLVLRSVKDTGKTTAKGIGSVFEYVGNQMADNKPQQKGESGFIDDFAENQEKERQSYEQILEEQRLEQEKEEEERKNRQE